MKWVTRLLGSALVVASLLVGGVAGQPVSATRSSPKVFINGDNKFYAYVKTGEKVNISFLNSGLVDGALRKHPVTVTIEAPDMTARTCTIPVNASPGIGCSFTQLTAPKPGVWSISVNLPDDAALAAALPNQRIGAAMFTWDIEIFDDTGGKAGRVWSEQYTIRQPDSADNAADITLYYQSLNGYLYRANYKGFSGQLTRLSADAFGVVKKDTCEPAYKSVEMTSKDFIPSYGKCGGSYKIFFESPSDDLPATATRWDGTLESIRSQVDRAEVTGLKFAPSDDVNTQSGAITFKLKNFIGVYEIKVDVNDDGNFDGAKDVTIPGRLKFVNDPGDQVVQYDGLDRDGKIIDKKQPIRIKLRITKGAEIHLVASNVIGLAGGLTLSRLSGDNAPSHNVCWNDAELGVQDSVSTEAEVDGSSCPDSSNGVHRWKYNEAWGKNRYIDNWIFSTAKVAGAIEIRYVNKEVVAQEAITRRNTGIGIGVAAIITLGLVIGGVIWMKKRSKKNNGNNFGSPTNMSSSQSLPPFQDPPAQFPVMQDPPFQSQTPQPPLPPSEEQDTQKNSGFRN